MRKNIIISLALTLLATSCSRPTPPTPDEYSIGVNSDGHVHFQEKSLKFGKDDFNPIDLEFRLDEGYAVNNATVLPENSATCYFFNQTLTITPLVNTDITININSTNYCKTVYFETGDGSLVSSASHRINIPYGRTWGEYVDKRTQLATYNNFKFMGWSFNSNYRGELIDDNMVIDENTPNHVYAVYHHQIIIARGQSVSVTDYNYLDGQIYVSFALFNPLKYDIPKKENIKIKSGEVVEGIDFDYYANRSFMLLSIPDNELLNSGYVTFIIGDNQPTYEVTPEFVPATNHLKFTAIKNPVKGEDYTFKLDVYNPANSEESYYIPYQLGITLTFDDGTSSILSSNAYKIVSTDTYRQHADVTIFGRYVKGDIAISGDAPEINTFYYELSTFGGVKVKDGTEEKEFVKGYQEASKEAESVILELVNDQKVASKNIAIKFNEEEWYQFSELPTPYNRIIEYNANHQIIINSSALGLVTRINSISIYIAPPDYSFFKNASWDVIDTISDAPSPYLEQIFALGEEREQRVGHNIYHLRIIGFNHDKLADPTETGKNYASLTIEFKEIIADENHELVNGAFSNGDYHNSFLNGPLDNYLNDIFIDLFSTDFANVVKTVSKKYFYAEEIGSDLYSYDTRLFPLALCEYDYDKIHYYEKEGSPYEFYKNLDEEAKKQEMRKTGPDGSIYSSYWTRTSSQNYPSYTSFRVDGDGNVDFEGPKHNYGYTAAFCI